MNKLDRVRNMTDTTLQEDLLTALTTFNTTAKTLLQRMASMSETIKTSDEVIALREQIKLQEGFTQASTAISSMRNTLEALPGGIETAVESALKLPRKERQELAAQIRALAAQVTALTTATANLENLFAKLPGQVSDEVSSLLEPLTNLYRSKETIDMLPAKLTSSATGLWEAAREMQRSTPSRTLRVLTSAGLLLLGGVIAPVTTVLLLDMSGTTPTQVLSLTTRPTPIVHVQPAPAPRLPTTVKIRRP